MWDTLTPADVEHAKHDVELRRAEALSRHAEELKALNTRHAEEISAFESEEAQIETFVRVAEAFAAQFKKMPSAAAVIDAEATISEKTPSNETEDAESPGSNLRHFVRTFAA